MKRLVVVGDALLDRDLDGTVERLCPDAPAPVVDDIAERARPGGAALAAALAAGDGREVVLVTALADDAGGRRLRALLSSAGVEVVDLGLVGATPEKVRVRADGRPLVRLDYGGRAAGRVGRWTGVAARAVAGAPAVLVADYGRGLTALQEARRDLADAALRRPVVWDPHRRGAPPVPGARLATPNRSEAGCDPTSSLAEVTGSARGLRSRWEARAVAITLGSQGALLVEGDDPPLVAPAVHAASGDPCGAGDRFASACAQLLADGALPSEAVIAAVGLATSFVAAGGAGALRFATGEIDLRAPDLVDDDALAPARRIKAAGGTVVATGGCFDLLHAGHVSVLEAARRLGDCLVVLLNSDDSVRRLKGPTRPLQSQEDRAAVLLALGCVDAVHVFGEDTPAAALDRLRPDIFAKGGDYSLATLPEASVLAGWGGQTVVLPYLEGRSTSRLVKEAARGGD
ncbi:MAG: PfkB family carbohydrate kinase [Actinomycetota bacterium]|nr:PfkB family carbohydrate kinase [Actinomycetota bacterium]PLS74805.1 MAG: D-beta-D-heptose 1-phosphate adenosyltransferase [Actinomycetota bacterium]